MGQLTSIILPIFRKFFMLCSPLFYSVRHHCMDRMACGSSSALLCTANSVSIIAVSKYAKRIFAKYWGKYTSMGDSFPDSVQGLKELKIFKADEAQHTKMNRNKRGLPQDYDKVLVMQLASTTIMDLVAYGAGIAVLLWRFYRLLNGSLHRFRHCSLF